MKIKLNLNYIAVIFWTGALASFTFQCYFPMLSKMIVPFLGLYFIFNLKNIRFKVNGWWKLYLLFFLYLCVMLLTSALKQSSFTKGVRFFLILAGIPLFEIIKPKNFDLCWNIFQVITAIKAILILITWIHIYITQNFADYRLWALSNGVGDIYIINGIPKIQLTGSTLFVMGFVIGVYRKRKIIDAYVVLMLLGAMAAGNTAYVLGIVAFSVIYYRKNIIKLIKDRREQVIIVSIFLILVLSAFVKYAENQLQIKSSNSNKVRIEQAEVLLDTNLLFGSGLGNSIEANISTVKYSNNTYFELQTLYIFNQIGTIGLLVFYVLTFAPLIEDKRKLLAYSIYLIYTFWNPYCFDSTHMIALVLINNAVTTQKYEETIRKKIINSKQPKQIEKSPNMLN